MGGLVWVCLIHDRNSWNASLNTFISLKFCKMGFHVVNRVLHLFLVEMRCLVLELNMSNVTDIVEKDNQQPMRDQVITMESELILYLFVECCSHLTNIQNFWLLW